MPPLEKPEAIAEKIEQKSESSKPEKVEPSATAKPVEEKVEPVVEKVEPVKEEAKVAPPSDIAKPVVKEPKQETKPKAGPSKKKSSKKDEVMKALNQSVEDLKVAVGMAALSGQECVEAIGKHGKLVVGVLEQNVDDSDNDKAWHDVIGAANEKSEALKNAQEKLSAAKEQLEKVAEAYKSADKSHADADVADKEMEAAHDKIMEISKQMQAAKKESYLVEQYRDLVEEGRQQFRKELAALLPGQVDHQPGQSRQPLTEEEMNVFVTHAYKRVASLQQQLAKLKLLQQQIDQTSMSDKQLRKQVVTE